MQALDPEERRASEALSTLALASLVLGILAVLLSPVLVGGLLGLVGLTLGIVQRTLGNVRRWVVATGLGLSLLGVAASAGAGYTYYRLYQSRPFGMSHPRANPYTETLAKWEGQPAPALSLATVDGGTFRIEGLKGRPVVLNFWATWCRACVKEIPDLNRLSADVAVIGISNEPEETLRDFMKTHTVSYPVISADDLPAPFDEIPALPTTVFVGPDGVIRKAVVGGQDYQTLKEAAAASTEPARAAAAPRGARP
jgi:peroxiredoxin